MNQHYIDLGLKNALQREESYKKDCKFFESQLRRLTQPMKQEPVEDLSPEKVLLPVLSQGSNEEEIMKYTQKAADLEQRIKEETDKSSQLDSKLNLLKSKYAEFPEKDSSHLEQSKSCEHYKNLERQLNVTIKSGKSSANKLKLQITELENKIKSLDQSALKLKSAILKKNVQVRLLQQSLYSDLSQPDLSLQFLYKPTLKNLYK